MTSNLTPQCGPPDTIGRCLLNSPKWVPNRHKPVSNSLCWSPPSSLFSPSLSTPAKVDIILSHWLRPKALNSSLTLHFLKCCKESVSKFFHPYRQNIHRIRWLLTISTVETLVQAMPVSQILATASHWFYCTQLSLLWFNQETSFPAMTSYIPYDNSQHPGQAGHSDLICSSSSPSLLIQLALQTGGAPFPQDLCTCSFCLESSHSRIRRAYFHSSPSAPMSLLFQLKCHFLSKTLLGNLI